MKFREREDTLDFMNEGSSKLTSDHGLDLMTLGQRLRHLRRSRGLTLAELGERVGRAPSALSLLENGRREPKLSVLEDLASALSVDTRRVVPTPMTRTLRVTPSLPQAKLPLLKDSVSVVMRFTSMPALMLLKPLCESLFFHVTSSRASSMVLWKTVLLA